MEGRHSIPLLFQTENPLKTLYPELATSMHCIDTPTVLMPHWADPSNDGAEKYTFRQSGGDDDDNEQRYHNSISRAYFSLTTKKVRAPCFAPCWLVVRRCVDWWLGVDY